MEPLTIRLQTLTPIWTGGVDPQKCDRIHETSIIGSLRWWYEAIVRGLGGYACDPTSDNRCPGKDDHRCPACELFGCTGWSRKFRLRMLDEHNALISKPLNKDGITFNLGFLEIKELIEEEKWLLLKTIEIICQYGSIGGRTVRKPEGVIKDKIGKDDFGLIHKLQIPILPDISQVQINNYLKLPRFTVIDPKRMVLRKNDEDWPNLKWFFFVTRDYLNRKELNRLVGLSEDGRRISNDTPLKKFLRGRKPGKGKSAESKKLFSFESNGGRLWGYVTNQRMLEEVIEELSQMEIHHIISGNKVLSEQFIKFERLESE